MYVHMFNSILNHITKKLQKELWTLSYYKKEEKKD